MKHCIFLHGIFNVFIKLLMTLLTHVVGLLSITLWPPLDSNVAGV